MSLDNFLNEDAMDLLACDALNQAAFDEEILGRNPNDLSVIRRVVEVVACQGSSQRALQLNRRVLLMQPLVWCNHLLAGLYCDRLLPFNQMIMGIGGQPGQRLFATTRPANR